MDFSKALEALKDGKQITNLGWNGKDQYIFMMPGYLKGVPANETLAKAAEVVLGETVIIDPYLMLKNAQGHFVNWVPSTGDLFSDKWIVKE